MFLPLYELFMNIAPWIRFACPTGAQGKGAPRHSNRIATQQARVNWRRYHTRAAGEYNRARFRIHTGENHDDGLEPIPQGNRRPPRGPDETLAGHGSRLSDAFWCWGEAQSSE